MRNLTRNLTHSGVSRQNLLDDEVSSNSSSVILQHETAESGINPFLGSDEEVGTDDVQKKIKNTASSIPDYKGYYSKKGDSGSGWKNSSNLGKPLSKFGAASPINVLSSNDIWKPPEYDRYPQVSSRVASMLPTAQQQQKEPQNSPVGSSSSLSSNQNPFSGEPDFSPFGGYPASSFPLMMEEKEEDDYLHNPDPEEEARLDNRRFFEDFKHMSKKSFGGFAGLILLVLGGAALFIVLPALTFTGATKGNYHNVIEILTLYEYPQLSAIRTNLIDKDTPDDFKTKTARDGSLWKLTFSDEFNAE
ncbi:hypothetical protein ZYGM_000064, partial [Zygosaccharomyces mellis]